MPFPVPPPAKPKPAAAGGIVVSPRERRMMIAILVSRWIWSLTVGLVLFVAWLLLRPLFPAWSTAGAVGAGVAVIGIFLGDAIFQHVLKRAARRQIKMS